MSVVALVGAQYGSEGKGAIAAKIAQEFDVHVRTGAPNAGHTYYIESPHGEDDDLIKVVARSVPVGAINKNATLVIGPGGMLDVDLLIEEVQQLSDLGMVVAPRLYIDRRALVIDDLRHKAYEGGIRGHAHEKIGSTGEGVGIARMAHLARGVLAKDAAWGKIDHAGDPSITARLRVEGISVIDSVPRVLSLWDETGSKILLEGTQGSGLSSVYGPWPYCTSADANSGQLLVDAGISPQKLTGVILVARTFPIRVAGESGPLKDEISWEELGVEPEITTVTKKVRRVGRWDGDLFAHSLMLNRPATKVALTFMDYIDPLCYGMDSWLDLPKKVIEFVRDIEFEHDCQVAYVGTGPHSVCVNPASRRWTAR